MSKVWVQTAFPILFLKLLFAPEPPSKSNSIKFLNAKRHELLQNSTIRKPRTHALSSLKMEDKPKLRIFLKNGTAMLFKSDQTSY